MRWILISTFTIISTFSSSLFAQVPDGFTYQAVLRNSNGQLEANRPISVEIGLVFNSPTYVPSYEETHSTTTNDYGQFSLVIGSGNSTIGLFENLDWSNEKCWAKIKVTDQGSNTLIVEGIERLYSVPYAIYSGLSGYADTSSYAISALNDSDSQQFSFSSSGDTLFISNGNYVIVPGLSFANTTTGLTLPTVSTNQPLNISSSSVILNLTINSYGGGVVQTAGFCLSTSPNPDLNDTVLYVPPQLGTSTYFLDSLTPSTGYYIRAFAVNQMGVAYGQELYFGTAPATGGPVNLSLGDYFQGGYVGYIYQPGDPGYIPGEVHGIIYLPFHIGGSVQWGCHTMTVGTSAALGSGYSNSLAIVAAHDSVGFYSNPSQCTLPPNQTGVNNGQCAAKLCMDLQINGYSDWCLPSADDLNALYNSQTSGSISMTGASLWNSTERPGYEDKDAGYKRFNNGSGGWTAKSSNTLTVWPVRYF